MANDTKIHVKQELFNSNLTPKRNPEPGFSRPASIIDLSSSDSESDSDSSSSDDDNITNRNNNAKNKSKTTAEGLNAVLPVGFLDPLPTKQTPSPRNERLCLEFPSARVNAVAEASAKQFWKAGDYEGAPGGVWDSSNGGMDHVRVHPKFLHSNATSHKWVLGAFAELLDNSLGEVCNGATYVNVDMVKSQKDGSKMLLIEDNGGGMDPDKMRHCMSLGYSAKSKLVDTIGQYGNGFKTSTMRLGADVIVFSMFGKDGRRSTQSIGLLSYTFLKSTGKEDIVVPMLDYERRGQDWNKIVRSSATDWNRNVETIAQWSPFSSEADLLQQFNQMQDQGTRIIIYNLWEDDQGLLELDFDTDPHDIQIRGVNRDEKSIDMAKKFPNSKHFLTYRHSLRSYAAILYLRIPPNFRIILRGEDVEHHNVVNDMMMSQEITYRPQPGVDGIPKDTNMVAIVTVGFVKDAKAHIDVQGFNVYHKNRLIKPFWRVWHPPGSDGRGVIGVLEANFVEPAHDKQGFERTTVLARLETRLIQVQKTYWSSNCHKIGYAPRRSKNVHERDSFPRSPPLKKKSIASSDKTQTRFASKGNNNGHLNGKGDVRTLRKRPIYVDQSSSSEEDVRDNGRQNHTPRKQTNGSSSRKMFGKDGSQNPSGLRSQENGFNNNEFSPSSSSSYVLAQLKEENLQLRDRLKRKEEEILGDLLHDLQKEKERSKSLEAQLQEATRKYEELSKEQESLIDIFSEERQRRDVEEENLRKKLKDASNTIQQLLDKLRSLEKISSNGKFG
ncbi:hypothetical protein DH2020_018956 [Rehmannia glutinosa]|uniref:Morc S5 domain-containing protein n=1 Tax=Rehmannia glutinosa TaxID=99300 RepID=A0ABR0WLT6_REHGL